jgi:hypothetical protein
MSPKYHADTWRRFGAVSLITAPRRVTLSLASRAHTFSHKHTHTQTYIYERKIGEYLFLVA